MNDKSHIHPACVLTALLDLICDLELKRDIAHTLRKAVQKGYLIREGKTRGVKYSLTPLGKLGPWDIKDRKQYTFNTYV